MDCAKSHLSRNPSCRILAIFPVFLFFIPRGPVVKLHSELKSIDVHDKLKFFNTVPVGIPKVLQIFSATYVSTS